MYVHKIFIFLNKYTYKIYKSLIEQKSCSHRIHKRYECYFLPNILNVKIHRITRMTVIMGRRPPTAMSSVFEIPRVSARKPTNLRADSLVRNTLGSSTRRDTCERSVAGAVTGKCGKHGKPTVTTANATVSTISCCDGDDRRSRGSCDEVPARSSSEVRSRAVKLI